MQDIKPTPDSNENIYNTWDLDIGDKILLNDGVYVSKKVVKRKMIGLALVLNQVFINIDTKKKQLFYRGITLVKVSENLYKPIN